MKRINTLTPKLEAMFTKPERQAEWLTLTDIAAVRTNLLESKSAMAILDRADWDVKYVSELFLEGRTNDQAIVNALNGMHAVKEHVGVVIGRLSVKMTIPTLVVHTNFHKEKMKSILAATIINGLIGAGIVEEITEPIRELKPDGSPIWRNQTFVSFGTKVREELYIPGIHMEPTVVQKKTKTRIGGKSVKLSGSEKLFLKNMSGTRLRLVQTPREVLEAYFKSSEWYTNVLNGKVLNMDRIVAKALVVKYCDAIQEIQKLDGFYLSLWIDYRTRLYYDLVFSGINPHGKTFETSQYELADPELITEQGAEDLFYNAVAIIDGRVAHFDAIQRFYRVGKEHYLAALRADTGNINKDFYNSRLADAIEDYYNEVPSHFLLSEDATNGGLQHGGIGFKSTKMMLAANVGGSIKQEDSHGNLQKSLGLATRDEAKDVHQPLLHGSSMNTVAEVIGKSIPETEAMLIKAYGREVLNIERIADWGTKVAGNHNTSLQWTTMDGFKAQSIAYTEAVPLKLHSLSSVTKSGYSTTTISRDMPLLVDVKGQPIYGSIGKDKSMGGSVKLRGLYANVTHSIDASVLRGVGRTVRQDQQGIMFKHDNFLVHPNNMRTVRHSYKAGLKRAFNHSCYESALNDIVSNYRGDGTPIAPNLMIGQGTEEMIDNSHYYLAP